MEVLIQCNIRKVLNLDESGEVNAAGVFSSQKLIIM